MAKNLKTAVSFRLTDEEHELLAVVAEQFAGNKTKALVAGLQALTKGDARKLTKAQLLAELERRLR